LASSSAGGAAADGRQQTVDTRLFSTTDCGGAQQPSGNNDNKNGHTGCHCRPRTCLNQLVAEAFISQRRPARPIDGQWRFPCHFSPKSSVRRVANQLSDSFVCVECGIATAFHRRCGGFCSSMQPLCWQLAAPKRTEIFVDDVEGQRNPEENRLTLLITLFSER
jgi:hypothetical protein